MIIYFLLLIRFLWEILTYMLNWIRKCSGRNCVSSLILRENMISLVLFLSLSLSLLVWKSLSLITRMKIKSLSIYCLYFTIISFRYIFLPLRIGVISFQEIHWVTENFICRTSSLITSCCAYNLLEQLYDSWNEKYL